MGWDYDEISLQDMTKIIKGFVDILILGSGYQSSGRLAHWDPINIKKAFQWGLFFENVLGCLRSSDLYIDSVKELEAVLSEITSDPSFPQGLVHLSVGVLSKGRSFVLEHFINNLPLRDSHLRALLTAVIECNDDVSDLTMEQLLKRQSAVSCISSLETGLKIISNSVKRSHNTESDYILMKEQLMNDKASGSMRGGQQLVQLSTWNLWKSRNLSYFLEGRTIKLVSGASLIFSTPHSYWGHVLGRLKVSSESNDHYSLEKIELLLLGCVASRWSCVINQIMSVSYNSLTISEQYNELCSLLREANLRHHNDEPIDLERGKILEFLNDASQLRQLWKMPPALVAAAIPSWSPLFRLYFSDIEAQFRSDLSALRYCRCSEDSKEHQDCEVAERIWCLYIFHVC